jgi:uncharacterized protein YdhG (YjbR/CyaY superfamily)
MAKTDYKSVEAYVAAQPDAVRPVLKRVRDILRKALPKAEEVISYQIATFKLNGRAVVYFAGWKEHYSLYPATSYVVSALKKELSPYKLSKGTIRLPLDDVPTRLITRVAKLRAEEVAALKPVKAKAKKKAAPAKRRTTRR